MKIRSHTVNAFGVLMIPVKAQFLVCPQQRGDCTGHSNRQAGNVENRMNPIPLDIMEHGFEIA